jgi:hypothetical protein
MTPKRRLGKVEQTVRNVVSTHFSRAWVLKRGLRTVEKCVEKMFRTVCSDLPNLRLGTQFMLPNEDLGWRNKRWNPDFRPTFQWFLAQIEYSPNEDLGGREYKFTGTDSLSPLWRAKKVALSGLCRKGHEKVDKKNRWEQTQGLGQANSCIGNENEKYSL